MTYTLKLVKAESGGPVKGTRILRAVARGAGSVLDFVGAPDPELRRRVSRIRNLTPTGALLKDQAVLGADLERAVEKIRRDFEPKTAGNS